MLLPMLAASLGGHLVLLMGVELFYEERRSRLRAQQGVSLPAQEVPSLTEAPQFVEMVVSRNEDPARERDVGEGNSRGAGPANAAAALPAQIATSAASQTTSGFGQLPNSRAPGAAARSTVIPRASRLEITTSTEIPHAHPDDGDSRQDRAEGGANGSGEFEDQFGVFRLTQRPEGLSPTDAAASVGHLDVLEGDQRGGPHLSDEALAGRVSSDLARATVARHLSRRPDPVLTPMDDGGYRWQNLAITARIHPNGEVSFGNKDIGNPRLAQSLMGEDFDTDIIGNPRLPAALIGVEFDLDITGMLMRALGQNPYRYEEQWFMDHTEEVRAELRASWSRRVMSQGMRELPARLDRIWREAGTASRRRQRLFETWAECDESVHGRAAQETILQYVRRRLPGRSPHAYTEAHLTELNHGRRRRFAPYGAGSR